MNDYQQQDVAFPENLTSDGHQGNGFPGLTKLEYFTAAAMQGLLSNGVYLKMTIGNSLNNDIAEFVAKDALNIAKKTLNLL